MPSTTTATSPANTTPRWGIDLGGTKIEGAIVDPVQCDHALWRLRVPTESERGYEHIFRQIGVLVVPPGRRRRELEARACRDEPCRPGPLRLTTGAGAGTVGREQHAAPAAISHCCPEMSSKSVAPGPSATTSAPGANARMVFSASPIALM